MSRTNFDTLLEAGCHFGHLKRKWNPAMAPYIFMERNGIHIIDLHKTVAKVDEAAEALKQIAKSGKKVLFVATKKQAKQVVADKAASVNMPYVRTVICQFVDGSHLLNSLADSGEVSQHTARPTLDYIRHIYRGSFISNHLFSLFFSSNEQDFLT